MGKKSKKGRSNTAKKATNTTVVTTANTTVAPTPKEEPKPDIPVKETNAPEPTTTRSNQLPAGLESSLSILTPSQRTLATELALPPYNQARIFAAWESASDEDKISSMEQLERMDKAYPSGGLKGYIDNARDLLLKSKQGVNPLEGWKPEVPQGENVDVGMENYDKFEKMGMDEVGKCGFALVAGGLGERLGYGGIKLGLPIEIATETTYLQYYIETILAIQNRYSAPDVKLPLCIMVSNDTNRGTIELLEKNNYFGMDKDQITIVQQGDGVPALQDNDASFAMDPDHPCKIQAKPHGHGDIHALLHSNKVAMNWLKKGLEWIVFFQDTNGLAFHTLPLALGVSKSRDLVMNSLAVPRKAKQAVGGICTLKNDKGEERTINVEYNQLDPLLRASGFPNGDENDPQTGFSPYPGNINQLVFKLKPYFEALLRTNGAMPEFVNPKYADEAKTVFKKPTRLECMMQDFPTVLSGDNAKHVGFTSIPADICFSPVKNATSDGVALQAKGTAPGVAASGEADQYGAVRKIMRSIGCDVQDAPVAYFSGISVVPGPEIVLRPSFVVCPAEYKAKFPNPSSIKISSKSSLIVEGDVVIESLDLDGALIIKCEEGASGVLRDVRVKNKGWEKDVNISDTDPEFIRIRGYRMNKIETKTILFKKDGSVEGYAPKVEKAEIESAEVESEPVKETIVEKEKNSVNGASSPPSSPRKTDVKTPVTEDSARSKSPKVDTSDVEPVALDLSRPNTPEAVSKQSESTCCIVS